MPVTHTDIDAFGQFAKQQISGDTNELSLQHILNAWQAKREAEATAEDIRQGIADIESGKGKPAAQAFADVRKKLGFAE